MNRLLDRVFLVRRVVSDIERDVALILTSQVEILTRLKELKKMTVVVAEPGDRAAVLSELWQIRDLLEKSDPDIAARVHAIYNALVVTEPRPPAA